VSRARAGFVLCLSIRGKRSEKENETGMSVVLHAFDVAQAAAVIVQTENIEMHLNDLVDGCPRATADDANRCKQQAGAATAEGEKRMERRDGSGGGGREEDADGGKSCVMVWVCVG